MAVQRALESRHPTTERLFSDPLADLFVARTWRLVLLAARVGPARRLIERLYDRIGGPGPRASAVARTRLIDDWLAEASQHAKQLVILGAGFDSRTYRLPVLAGTHVFEVDQPATQARKRQRLAGIKMPPICRVGYVAVDFERDDLVRALLDGGYDPQAGGVFLWEGVTNYLSAAGVDATLAAIRQLAAGPSTLIFTYVDQAALERGAGAFPEAARWMQGVVRRGEPWTFGLNPARLRDFLARRGLALARDLSTEEAGARYFNPLGRAEHGSRLYHVAMATMQSPPMT